MSTCFKRDKVYKPLTVTFQTSFLLRYILAYRIIYITGYHICTYGTK